MQNTISTKSDLSLFPLTPSIKKNQLQVNVSIGNVNGIISDLTSIVTTASETSDQNSDSLEVIANLLTQSVDVIITQNASLAVISLVSLWINGMQLDV